MTRRSTTNPTAPAASAPLRIAMGSGRPARAVATVTYAPHMMNSPCARLITPHHAKDHREATGGEHEKRKCIAALVEKSEQGTQGIHPLASKSAKMAQQISVERP